MDPIATRLVEEIARLTLAEGPADAHELRSRYDSVGVTSSCGLEAKHGGGWVAANPGPTDSAHRIMSAFKELRSLTSTTNGAFFIATVMVDRSGNYSADLDYDTEPEFDFPIDPRSYASDLEANPRDPSTYPGWLRDRLAELP